MWNRGYIPRLRTGELPWQEAAAAVPGFADGTQLRVLSRDEAAGATTCLWRLPPGWAQPAPFARAADEELFVLAGSLEEAGVPGEAPRHVPHGSYRFQPRGHRHAALASPGGALLLAMWSAPPRPFEVGTLEPGALAAVPWLDTHGMTERPTPIEGPVPGIQVRILRQDAATGGMTLIVAIPPRWEEPRSEHHDCVEESYKLSGEIWLREDQRPHTLAAGDYFFRPPRIKHGPMRTVSGTASLIRFSGAVVNHYGPIDAE
jgi:quercetin dioxygenase-like cupin family protein